MYVYSDHAKKYILFSTKLRRWNVEHQSEPMFGTYQRQMLPNTAWNMYAVTRYTMILDDHTEITKKEIEKKSKSYVKLCPNRKSGRIEIFPSRRDMDA